MSDKIPRKLLDRHKFQHEEELINALQEAADSAADLGQLEEALSEVFSIVKTMTLDQWRTFRDNRKNTLLLKKALHLPGSVELSKCQLLYMKTKGKEENIFASLAQGFLIKLPKPARTIAEYFTDPDFCAAILSKQGKEKTPEQQQCPCGCGQPVAPGKKYFNDSCSNRMRQRKHQKKMILSETEEYRGQKIISL